MLIVEWGGYWSYVTPAHCSSSDNDKNGFRFDKLSDPWFELGFLKQTISKQPSGTFALRILCSLTLPLTFPSRLPTVYTMTWVCRPKGQWPDFTSSDFLLRQTPPKHVLHILLKKKQDPLHTAHVFWGFWFLFHFPMICLSTCNFYVDMSFCLHYWHFVW